MSGRTAGTWRSTALYAARLSSSTLTVLPDPVWLLACRHAKRDDKDEIYAGFMLYTVNGGV